MPWSLQMSLPPPQSGEPIRRVDLAADWTCSRTSSYDMFETLVRTHANTYSGRRHVIFQKAWENHVVIKAFPTCRQYQFPILIILEICKRSYIQLAQLERGN